MNEVTKAEKAALYEEIGKMGKSDPMQTIREALECAATADWLPRGMRAKYRDAIDALDTLAGQEAVELSAAAKAVTALNGHIWDRTDGALVIPAQSVERWDAAFDRLRLALGEIQPDDYESAYAAPVVQQQVDDARDAERLEYICTHIVGHHARALVGVLSHTGDMSEWRRAIDAAISRVKGEAK